MKKIVCIFSLAFFFSCINAMNQKEQLKDISAIFSKINPLSAVFFAPYLNLGESMKREIELHQEEGRIKKLHAIMASLEDEMQEALKQ